MSQEKLPSEAENIRIAAEVVPGFREILEELTDEEVLDLDSHMNPMGKGGGATLKELPGLYQRLKGTLEIDWPTFESLVREWKNAGSDRDPSKSTANEGYSLSVKRSAIAKKLVTIIENG